MKHLMFFLAVGVASFMHLQAQDKDDRAEMTPQMTEKWSPKPQKVDPGKLPCGGFNPPPSDAIVLFNGTDLSHWQEYTDRRGRISDDTVVFTSNSGDEAKWDIVDGILVVDKKEEDIRTKQLFDDFQLHIEWKIPEDITGEGQLRGNSGIFLQGIYELQILDVYENKTYVNGQAASIYKQTPPMVNAMRPPGEWNVYDIIYQAPTYWKNGAYKTKPTITVLHNGVLVHHNTKIHGTTSYIGLPKVVVHGKGPVGLQAHDDESEPISFRNIWIREL